MDILILVIAWIIVIWQILIIFIGPFIIGKPREPLEATEYVSALFLGAALILVCGRIIGWW